MTNELATSGSSLDFAGLLKGALSASLRGQNPVILLVGAFLTGLISVFIVTAPPMALGYTAVCLKIARGQEASWDDLFSGFSRFGASFALGVLAFVAITIGLILLVVPGLVLAFLFTFAFHLLAVDSSLSGMDALKGSVQLVKSRLADVVVLWVIGLVVGAVFSIVPVVGSLVAMGFMGVAGAMAFLKISGGAATR
ncbi:MAG: hypothetical protein IT384_04495 [Deltaproteobacteria bacterium]|nr:hypothetical protein [Deltaproteobacteria bacterium]